MKKLLLIILCVASAFSCKYSSEQRLNNKAIREVAHENKIENHNKEYTGTYKGTLPCADCDGIEVILHLKDNGEFRLKTKHIASSQHMKDIHTEYEGRYIWNNADRTITLTNINTQPNKYLYSDGNLIQLDMNGNRITGPLAERYILKE